MGCVIYFVLTRGEHPFAFNEKNIMKNDFNLSGIKGDENRICVDLIERMINNNKAERPSIEVVLNHPVFWDSVKTSNFYTAIKPIFSAKDSPNIKIDDFETIRAEIKKALEAKSAQVFGTDWLLKLRGKVRDFEIERQDKKNKNYNNRIRNSTSLIELLKYIADKARHWDEWPIEIRPDQPYIEYFSEKFPLLLIHTYNELRPFKSIIELQNFYK
jgi:serine/threonine-protein kinase/endoribonuclease IRE1